MADNQKQNTNKVNTRWMAAAANAVALLPKGKAGANHMSERKFYDAIALFGEEHGNTAATLLHSCAMANLVDANRRRDVATVIGDLRNGMSYITGKKSTRAMSSVHQIVSHEQDTGEASGGDDGKAEEFQNS